MSLPALAQDERPTGYPRSANEGSTKAIAISALYTSDVRSNVQGGVSRGTRYLDNLDLQVSVDAERWLGWRGAKLFAYGIYNNGVALSPTVVGDIQSISNVETDIRAARLFEAWVEQRVGRDASVKVGLYNLNSEFDTTESGGLFLISSHGIGPDLSQSGRNGPSIFPVTSLAVRGEVRLGANWLARAVVLDGVPGDPAHPRRTAVKLSSDDGALIVGEVNYLNRATKAAIGVWRYTARFETLDDAGASPKRGNDGAYVFAETRLVGERPDDPQGLAGWLRFGIAKARFNPIGSYLGGGLVYTGPIPDRDEDQAGIAFAAADFGNRYRRQPAIRDQREVVIEAAYRTVVSPWLSIEPDLQYVINPGGDPLLRNAVVIGFRVEVGR